MVVNFNAPFWVYYYPVAMQFDARPSLYPELIKQLYLDKEVNVFTNQGVLIKGKITDVWDSTDVAMGRPYGYVFITDHTDPSKPKFCNLKYTDIQWIAFT
ncbi:hypothetical protein J2T18_000776 [Paenibacillus polymyxa]|nr:hypothetical protein [Paenibacillus polymyxa]